MFENTGKSVDWLNEEVKEEVKHPLFEEEHYKEQDDNDYESGSLLNKQQSKNYENSNDYIPSWLQEDLAPPTTPSNNQSKKVRSTIKYKKPTKPTNSKSSEGKGWNFCCCCPKDPILYWFRVFHSLCGFMGVLSFISNLFILFDVALDFRNIIIHIYALFLCIIVVATELEIPFLLLRVNILESWVFRGLLYFFIGVISVTTGKTTMVVIYQDVVCLLLMLLGFVYTLMGLACLRSVESHRAAIQSNYYTELTDDFASPTKV